MAFAPKPVILTRIQRKLLTDLNRMAMALDSASVPFPLAHFVANIHGTIHATKMLTELCRRGFLHINRINERYELTDKPVPLARDCPLTEFPIALLKSPFFANVAQKWLSGNHEPLTYFVRTDDYEKASNYYVSEESIRRALTKPRKAVNGSSTAPTLPWSAIAANHLLLQKRSGGGLSRPQTIRLIAMHCPHLGSPQGKLTAMRSAGVLDTTGRQDRRGNFWMVSETAAKIIAELGINVTLSEDQAHALLDS